MDQQKPTTEGPSPAQTPAPVAPQPKPPVHPDPPVSGPLAQFEAWLYDMLVAKMPFQLPQGLKDWIVQYGPWITLVVGLLFLPLIFGAFAIFSYIGSMYGAYVPQAVGVTYYIAIVMLVIQVVVMFVSIPMLLKRQRNGWLLLFYADLLSLAYSLFNSFTYGLNIGALLGGLLGAAAAFYFLFQIRSYYKN